MPISGLSNQRRLPRLGKFRLGIKVPNKSGNGDHPQATEYFIIPEQLKELFPEHPTEIPIMIPVEDDEVWCPQYYKCYSSYRGKTCQGDGITCRRMIDKETGDKANRDTKEVVWKEMTCEGRNCPDYLKKDCKETMNLSFICPELPGLGTWQIDTGSINSIRNINNAAAMIRAVYKRISFIPLLLTLEPAEVVNPDDGKKKTVHVLNLRTHGTMKELMAQANQPVSELLLPSPADDEAPMDVPPDEELEKAPENVPPPVAVQQEAVNPATIEGTDAWFVYMIVKLNVKDASVIKALNELYKIPIEKINTVAIGDNFKMLTPENRTDLVARLKAIEAKLPKPA